MDQIILKYLLDDLTIEEQHKLRKWLEEDPLNPVILEKFEHHWKTRRPDLREQKDEVLKRIKSQMNEEQQPSESSSFNFPSKILKYAAIIFLVFVGAWLIKDIPKEPQVSDQVRYIEKTSLMGQKISLKLPDGTQVKLNADSKLTVPEKFSGSSREVELIGEAYFDVVKDSSKPFIIKMPEFSVEVKGTSFDVKAYPNEDKVVAVRSGIVEVSSKGIGKSVELTKDEMSKISVMKNTIEKSQILDQDLIFGWVDQDLIFKNQTMDEVLKEVARWYGVNIVMKTGKKSDKLYTARHDNNPGLKQVMESVSFVFEVKFEIDGNELTIK